VCCIPPKYSGSLGPKRYFAGARKGSINRCEQLLAIERDGEAFAIHFKPERMSLVRRHFGVRAVELKSA
jgi:hypothetical protein